LLLVGEKASSYLIIFGLESRSLAKLRYNFPLNTILGKEGLGLWGSEIFYDVSAISYI
jgi:hypothetical protein